MTDLDQSLESAVAKDVLRKLLDRFANESNTHLQMRAYARSHGWLIPLRDAGLITRVDTDGNWTYEITRLGLAWMSNLETRTLEEMKNRAVELCQRSDANEGFLVFIYEYTYLCRVYRNKCELVVPSGFNMRHTKLRYSLAQMEERWGHVPTDG